MEFLVKRLAEQEGEFQEGVTEEEESSEEDCCDSYEEWHVPERGFVCMCCGQPESSHQG